ncbi:MAG TPA: hypothetical protein VJA66_09020 [Thermoanaerobaculia bacterium]
MISRPSCCSVLAISPILLFWDDPIEIYLPLAVCRAVIWIAVLVRIGLRL